MNTALLFFLLSLLFSALWVVECERRKKVQADLDKLKDDLEFAEYRAQEATRMYIDLDTKVRLAKPRHVSEEG